MSSQARVELDVLMAQTEEIWGHWDILFSSLDEKGWAQKHGKDWTFADVPYHLASIERDLLAPAILRGPDVPQDQQVELRTIRELNQWNDSKFAERPPDQPVEESLAQLEAAHTSVRQAVERLTDADLDRQRWFPAIDLRGWRPVRLLLDWNLFHNLNEFLVLRYYMKRNDPVPSPELAHRATALIMRRMKAGISSKPSKPKRFTFAMEFTDPGAGAWTFRLAEGKVELGEGKAGHPDFMMTTSLTMLFEMGSQKISLPLALITGKIKVRGMRHLGTFRRLTAPPGLDDAIEPVP